MLDTDEVKNAVQRYVEVGACQYVTNIDRVTDFAAYIDTNNGESQFKNLLDWERELAFCEIFTIDFRLLVLLIGNIKKIVSNLEVLC